MISHMIDQEVSLRLFTEDDEEEFHQLIMNSKEHLKTWITWIDTVHSQEDTNESLTLRIALLAENGGYPMWFAILYNGRMAGTIGFNEVDKTNRAGEIGYWLGNEFQGKGIMSKSFKAVIDYGFQQLKLNRIEAFIAAGNERSRALPEKFGFKEEGRIRQAEWLYDHYEDQIIYGLLAEDWKELPK
ncbi:GNAT family N-acetyltransferase [Pradoshia eiseniae]|uniref:GNAT family N-acetyltransferase n=1 Tax=Pradoshia eiseniae TaxID=2064768 RepID=A0A2S7N0V2_9BACI|nr:GNAT family protein [Pradoshia eiseniae]PQD95643.1 GNAT family N-acetyltransferase [Pradoshia eiseniae]